MLCWQECALHLLLSPSCKAETKHPCLAAVLLQSGKTSLWCSKTENSFSMLQPQTTKFQLWTLHGSAAGKLKYLCVYSKMYMESELLGELRSYLTYYLLHVRFIGSMMYWQHLWMNAIGLNYNLPGDGILLGAIYTLWGSAIPKHLLTASWPVFSSVCLWHAQGADVYTSGRSLVSPYNQWEEISTYRVQSPELRNLPADKIQQYCHCLGFVWFFISAVRNGVALPKP